MRRVCSDAARRGQADTQMSCGQKRAANAAEPTCWLSVSKASPTLHASAILASTNPGTMIRMARLSASDATFEKQQKQPTDAWPIVVGAYFQPQLRMLPARVKLPKASGMGF